MGHYMTKEERIILQTLLDEKKPVSYIARKLGCCRQTVYNEIKRGQYLHDYGYFDKLRYSAERGQQKHDYNQTAKGRPLKIGNDHAFAAYIEHKIIVDRYSPAAALAAARKYPFTTRICVSTLYSYIDKKVFYGLGNRHLWEKRKKRAKAARPERRVTHPKLPSIEIRPESIILDTDDLLDFLRLFDRFGLGAKALREQPTQQTGNDPDHQTARQNQNKKTYHVDRAGHKKLEHIDTSLKIVLYRDRYIKTGQPPRPAE